MTPETEIQHEHKKFTHFDFFRKQKKQNKSYSFMRSLITGLLIIQAGFLYSYSDKFENFTNTYDNISKNNDSMQNYFNQFYKAGDYDAMETAYNRLAHTPSSNANSLALWSFIYIMDKKAIPMDRRIRMAETAMAQPYYGLQFEKKQLDNVFNCSLVNLPCYSFKSYFLPQMQDINEEKIKQIELNISRVREWYFKNKI